MWLYSRALKNLTLYLNHIFSATLRVEPDPCESRCPMPPELWWALRHGRLIPLPLGLVSLLILSLLYWEWWARNHLGKPMHQSKWSPLSEAWSGNRRPLNHVGPRLLKNHPHHMPACPLYPLQVSGSWDPNLDLALWVWSAVSSFLETLEHLPGL